MAIYWNVAGHTMTIFHHISTFFPETHSLQYRWSALRIPAIALHFFMWFSSSLGSRWKQGRISMKRWLSNGWNGLSYLWTNPSLFIFVGNTSYIWVGKTSNPCFFFGISPAQALKTRSSRESFGNCMELPDLYEGSTYLKPCIWPAS